MDQDLNPELLKKIMEDLVQAGVEIRACPDTQKKLEGHSQLEMGNASEEDWKTEHLEMVLSVKTVAGLEEAIERGQAYVSAGADAIFVETPISREEYSQIADALGHVPLVADVTEGGKSPPLTADELYRAGFKIVLFSASAVRATMKTLQEFYRTLKRDRTTNGLLHTLVAFEERNRILGLPEIYDLEHRYAASVSAPD